MAPRVRPGGPAASVEAEAEKEQCEGKLFPSAKKIVPEKARSHEDEEFLNAELLAPESEWAVFEDPLESVEPNEPEADEPEAANADAHEPEAHFKTSGSSGPGHSEERETHPDAAGSNRAVSEQRTALSRFQALRVLYGRCPPK